MSEPPFYAGDLLQHRAWDETGHQWVNRQVKFKDYAADEIGIALVEFGQHSQLNGEIAPQVYRVPVRELHRPQPKPPIFGPVPQPTAAGATPSIVPPATDKLRDALRASIAARGEGKEKVDAAAALVARAEEALADVERDLARCANVEQDRADALEASLRNGSASRLQDDSLVIAREHAKRDVATAQTVLDRLQEQLRTAREKHREREAAVHSAALKIVVAIATREGAVLAELEQRASRKRAELHAVDQMLTGDFKLRIGDALSRLLSNPPAVVEDPIGFDLRQRRAENRTSRWRQLLAKLTAGDADAELEG